MNYDSIIMPVVENDFEVICEIINDGAHAHKGIIPDDLWHEPDISENELAEELKGA